MRMWPKGEVFCQSRENRQAFMLFFLKKKTHTRSLHESGENVFGMLALYCFLMLQGHILAETEIHQSHVLKLAGRALRKAILGPKREDES